MYRTLITALAALLALACVAAAAGAADDTNPAAAFEGAWASDRAMMTVAVLGENVLIDIVQDDGVTERVEWSYEASWDEAAGELKTPQTGRKTRTEYGQYLEDLDAVELYSDGEAAFRLDGGGGLVWTDRKEADGAQTQFHRPEDVPAEYDGMWLSGDGESLFITNMGTSAACVVWSADESHRWIYCDALYSGADGGLDTMANGVKTRIGIDPETVDYTTYEHEYTDGRAFFGLDADGRMIWREARDGDAPAIAFERVEYGDESDDGLHASVQHMVPSPEWVAKLPAAQDGETRQLFVVAGMGMDRTTATVSMHERDEDGRWMQLLSTPGYVGRNGLCPDADRVQGCGQTPIGTYTFNRAFGIAPDPGCEIPYVRVDDGTYWSGDAAHDYNRLVDIGDCPDLDTGESEHIVDYEYEYRYCLNISFNAECTPGRGAGIFLHCFGSAKPYTAGCVAIPENIMRLVMQYVCEDCVVVIDTLENLGGSL